MRSIILVLSQADRQGDVSSILANLVANTPEGMVIITQAREIRLDSE